MSLFALGDLHLSLGEDKPMDIFSGWNDYVQRLEENWKNLVSDDDTVVLAGDISWAMKLEHTLEDFRFIHNLPGKKMLLKGNHDYWWSTKRKMDAFLQENSLDSIQILFNNAYRVDEYAVCGTRGWFLENDEPEDIKVLNREVGRLKMSIEEALKLGGEPVVFLHYPPVFGNYTCDPILELIEKYRIERCYYGHVHGDGIRYAFNGNRNGTVYTLVSADFINFKPVCVESTDFS